MNNPTPEPHSVPEAMAVPSGDESSPADASPRPDDVAAGNPAGSESAVAPGAEEAPSAPPEHVADAMPDVAAAAETGTEKVSSAPADAASPTAAVSPPPEPEAASGAAPATPPAPAGVSPDNRRIIEALLFASDSPLSIFRIREAIPGISPQAFRETVEQLKDDYAKSGRAFEVVEIAEGFQILTKPEFEPWIARLKKVKAQAKLSSAALEALAIIAYKQPIRRMDIEAIRGVQSGELIRALLERGFIRIVGRADQPGAPLLYGTTKDFLDAVGLKSLADLPKPEEIKPDEPKAYAAREAPKPEAPTSSPKPEEIKPDEPKADTACEAPKPELPPPDPKPGEAQLDGPKSESGQSS
jgi:segregation and condensation protein B